MESSESTDDSFQDPPRRTRRGIWSLSLREYIGIVTMAMLTMGLVATTLRLRRSEQQLAQMRAEFGYLKETETGQIAAVRAPSDQPLTYRLRIRVPESSPAYRIAYSTLMPKKASRPDWYSAVAVPPGESLITVRILEDPRDHRWKIAILVGNDRGTQRMATALRPEHADIFRGSHQVVSTGVGRETLAVDSESSIRLLDERWLVGEEGLLLYGDRAPQRDQIGIYAELQPDVGPL